MERAINFTKHRKITVLSVAAIVLGFIMTFVVNGGFNMGIDFQAGLNQQVKISSDNNITDGEVRDLLKEFDASVVTVGDKDANQFAVKIQDTEEADFQKTMPGKVLSALKAAYGEASVEELSSEFVNATFSSNLASSTVLLTVFALLLILVYVWIRFQLNYACSAIVAIFHDVLFLMAFIGAVGLEISTGTIAAVLTIIGYSLNDTIVIFDRIRENDRIVKDTDFEGKVNLSLTQSLSRTLITSITTFIAVLAIFIFASGAIKEFALSLMVGIIVGTYSSIFVASNMLFVWYQKSSAKLKDKLTQTQGPIRTV